jgi:hypothetical protein
MGPILRIRTVRVRIANAISRLTLSKMRVIIDISACPVLRPQPWPPGSKERQLTVHHAPDGRRGPLT